MMRIDTLKTFARRSFFNFELRFSQKGMYRVKTGGEVGDKNLHNMFEGHYRIVISTCDV